MFVSTEVSEFLHLRLTTCAQFLSCFCLFANPWTVAHQAPLSMGFPRQEHWNGLPFPSLGTVFFFFHIPYHLENFPGIYSYNILFIQYISLFTISYFEVSNIFVLIAWGLISSLGKKVVSLVAKLCSFFLIYE